MSSPTEESDLNTENYAQAAQESLNSNNTTQNDKNSDNTPGERCIELESSSSSKADTREFKDCSIVERYSLSDREYPSTASQHSRESEFVAKSASIASTDSDATVQPTAFQSNELDGPPVISVTDEFGQSKETIRATTPTTFNGTTHFGPNPLTDANHNSLQIFKARGSLYALNEEEKQAAVLLKNVSFRYSSKSVVLNDISLCVPKGSFL